MKKFWDFNFFDYDYDVVLCRKGVLLGVVGGVVRFVLVVIWWVVGGGGIILSGGLRVVWVVGFGIVVL